jgi:hypothetical protein
VTGARAGSGARHPNCLNANLSINSSLGYDLHEQYRASAAPRKGAIMIFLRLIALLAAGLVLILPPLVAAEPPTRACRDGSPSAAWPAWRWSRSASSISPRSATACAAPAHVRTLGGLLLLIPAAAGIATLATRTDAALLWGSGLLLSFTVMLFVSFVYPATPERRQRPMRQRERSERRAR